MPPSLGPPFPAQRGAPIPNPFRAREAPFRGVNVPPFPPQWAPTFPAGPNIGGPGFPFPGPRPWEARWNPPRSPRGRAAPTKAQTGAGNSPGPQRKNPGGAKSPRPKAPKPPSPRPGPNSAPRLAKSRKGPKGPPPGPGPQAPRTAQRPGPKPNRGPPPFSGPCGTPGIVLPPPRNISPFRWAETLNPVPNRAGADRPSECPGPTASQGKPRLRLEILLHDVSALWLAPSPSAKMVARSAARPVR